MWAHKPCTKTQGEKKKFERYKTTVLFKAAKTQEKTIDSLEMAKQRVGDSYHKV